MTIDERQERHRSACVACHRRKVRCIRLGESCTNCVQSNIQCRYALTSSSNARTARDQHGRPLRKRRGPYNKGKTPREKELEDVVRTLTMRCESLERQLQRLGPTDLASSSAGACNSFAADDSADQPLSHTFNVASGHVGLLPSPSLSPKGIPALPQPSQDQIFQLWHIYMTRVEPLTKLIPPFPFNNIALKDTASQLSRPDLRALTHSVCLAAINSLSEDEAIQRFNEGKDAMSARLDQCLQAIISSAEALQQQSIQLLQALVLDAVCLFRQENPYEARFSEIFERALDVFDHLVTETEHNDGISAYESEIRRRCGWTLRRLSYHRSHKSGSDITQFTPLSNVPLPLNINDIDLSYSSDEAPKARSGSTEMSFFLEHLEVIRLAAASEPLQSTCSLSVNDAQMRSRRNSLVENTVEKIEKEFLWHCDTSRPLDWFLMLTSKAMMNPIEIMMLDQGIDKTSCFGASSSCSQEDKKFLLHLDLVECWHLLRTNENLRPWRWFLNSLPQTFTVGDLQAELVKRPGSAYNDRAYALINLISHA